MHPEREGAGFLPAARARNAEEAIGHSEGLVAVLKLNQADLKPAEDALRIAKELFRAHDFSKAFAAARRAEDLALTLDERFAAYQKSFQALRIRIQELKRLGLPTEALEVVLGRSEEVVAAGILDGRILVPNYLEATASLDRAAEEGRDLLMKANAASNRIFLAEVAIETLAELPGIADPAAFSDGVVHALEESLAGATRELALANVEGAMRAAADVEARAERLHADFDETGKVLDETDTRLRGTRAKGAVTDRLERQVAYARDMRSRGLIEPALAMARRLLEDATVLDETYAKAMTGLTDAEVLYGRLVREGFHSYDADSAIRDARRALREGSYTVALDQLERAHRAFVRRRNVRQALAKALEETRRRVETLQSVDVPMLPDVREVLGRAEREFRQGNYSGSSEDLQMATVLLGKATVPHTPRA